MLLCTSFDSYKIASDKYPDLESHLEPLKKAGATILFDIDATKLESHKQVMDFCGLGGTKGKGKGKAKETALEEDGAGFDKIVFNFPHVGECSPSRSFSQPSVDNADLDFDSPM